MQVQFNGRTSAFQADDVGSIPTTCSKYNGYFIVVFLYLNKYSSVWDSEKERIEEVFTPELEKILKDKDNKKLKENQL